MGIEITSSATNAAEMQRGRPFVSGQSGNPSGKKPGTRNRTTLAVQELLDGEAEALSRKAIMLALAGDTTALRLCMERLLPVRREVPIQIDCPAVEKASDLPAAIAAVVNAATSGHITLSEARALTDLLEAQRRMIETADLEARLAVLEDRARHA